MSPSAVMVVTQLSQDTIPVGTTSVRDCSDMTDSRSPETDADPGRSSMGQPGIDRPRASKAKTRMSEKSLSNCGRSVPSQAIRTDPSSAGNGVPHDVESLIEIGHPGRRRPLRSRRASTAPSGLGMET